MVYNKKTFRKMFLSSVISVCVKRKAKNEDLKWISQNQSTGKSLKPNFEKLFYTEPFQN